ncbi:MAG: hypothetical protein H0U74_10345 [Bradymonadaceae bacterium]|nr:hypothetical protein [Lujinxingiaceae bacterium]
MTSTSPNNASGRRMLRIAAAALGFVLATAAVLWLWPAREAKLSDEQVLAKAAAFYETRPYYEQPHAYTAVPAGLPDLRAETCGACHTEIYEEWKLSTHRRAWLDDAQFQEELAKSRGDHAPGGEQNDVSWMCVNCHTPLVNQLEKLVIGLTDGDISKPIYADNPSFDPVLQLDAITCATCHVKDGIVYGPFGDTDAPHPVAKGDFLLSEENCVRCHQAEAIFPDQNLGCFFTTGEEWKAGPYPAEGQTCQSCHMPEVTRRLAPAFERPERVTRRHWFGGSLIPKHPDWEEEIAPLRAIFGSGAEIELLAGSDDEDDTKIKLHVRIRNANAGHLFPTGDPERHVDVEATARNADGDTIGQVSERFGSVYAWWPKIVLERDNRIAPREHVDLELSVPADGEPFSVEIVAHKYRMHLEAFEHHALEGRYVRGRVFHRSRWTVGSDGKPLLERVDDDHGVRRTQHP